MQARSMNVGDLANRDGLQAPVIIAFVALRGRPPARGYNVQVTIVFIGVASLRKPT